MAHSGEGSNQYADQSGMMGYSYSSDDAPLMCFNNAKNWQIGWFEKAKESVSVNSDYSGALTSQVNYLKEATTYQPPVVIEVIRHNSSNLYVGFNWKMSHNSGTMEGGNQVTIQEYAGTGYGESTMVAKLDVGGMYSAGDVTVEVISIDTSTGVADVIITNGDVT